MEKVRDRHNSVEHRGTTVRTRTMVWGGYVVEDRNNTQRHLIVQSTPTGIKTQEIYKDSLSVGTTLYLHGKQVFTQDIIHNGTRGMTGIVLFEGGRFIVREVGKPHKDFYGNLTTIVNKSGDLWEIIGNTFDHPHLTDESTTPSLYKKGYHVMKEGKDLTCGKLKVELYRDVTDLTVRLLIHGGNRIWEEGQHIKVSKEVAMDLYFKQGLRPIVSHRTEVRRYTSLQVQDSKLVETTIGYTLTLLVRVDGGKERVIHLLKADSPQRLQALIFRTFQVEITL